MSVLKNHADCGQGYRGVLLAADVVLAHGVMQEVEGVVDQLVGWQVEGPMSE